MSYGGSLVTGEAVSLELRLARLPSRALATALDFIIQAFGFVIGLLVLLSAVRNSSLALRTATVIAWVVVCFVVYPVAIETLSRGRSIGKIAAGIRVVRDDGSAIRFRHALVRGLSWLFLDFAPWFGCSPGIICSLLNPQAKRLGDLMAGTLVTRERTAQLGVPGLFVAPPLVSWVQSVEMSRISDGLAASIGQYLARYGELRPEVRDQLGNELADRLWTVVSPPPPLKVPAPAYLSALMAERQRRARVRMAPPPASSYPYR